MRKRLGYFLLLVFIVAMLDESGFRLSDAVGRIVQAVECGWGGCDDDAEESRESGEQGPEKNCYLFPGCFRIDLTGNPIRHNFSNSCSYQDIDLSVNTPPPDSRAS